MSGPEEPREPPEPMAERSFSSGGETWLVRVGGVGTAGAGSRGGAPVEALHFFRPGETRPRFEALLARGRLPHLFDRELEQLLRSASAVPPAG